MRGEERTAGGGRLYGKEGASPCPHRLRGAAGKHAGGHGEVSVGQRMPQASGYTCFLLGQVPLQRGSAQPPAHLEPHAPQMSSFLWFCPTHLPFTPYSPLWAPTAL